MADERTSFAGHIHTDYSKQHLFDIYGIYDCELYSIDLSVESQGVCKKTVEIKR